MAGDWIKFEVTTPDKPEVIQMAAILGICNDSVTGKALRIWCWANANIVTGESVCVTEAFLDRLAFCPGFAKAMRQVGWLEGEDLALVFPNFTRHNGKSAKERAVTSKRVSDHRGNGKCNADTVTKNVTSPLPEKRREEKSINNTLPPSQAQGGGLFGDEVEATDAAEPKKKWNPTSQQLQVAGWFNRRPTTVWSEREIKAWKKLQIEDEDLQILQWFYTESGYQYLRQDLQALLNNWRGEVDKARNFNPNTRSAI